MFERDFTEFNFFSRIVLQGQELLTSNMMVQFKYVLKYYHITNCPDIPYGCRETRYSMVEFTCELDNWCVIFRLTSLIISDAVNSYVWKSSRKLVFCIGFGSLSVTLNYALSMT